MAAPSGRWNVEPNFMLMFMCKFWSSRKRRAAIGAGKNVRGFDRMTIIYSNFAPARVLLMMWRRSAPRFAID